MKYFIESNIEGFIFQVSQVKNDYEIIAFTTEYYLWLHADSPEYDNTQCRLVIERAIFYALGRLNVVVTRNWVAGLSHVWNMLGLNGWEGLKRMLKPEPIKGVVTGFAEHRRLEI